MSTNKILVGSLIAAFGIAGLATSADAQSRYGSSYGNVYDYESGHCGNACAPAQLQTHSSRYGSAVTQPRYVQPTYVAPQMPIAPGPVYVDCRATGTCAPQPTTVYTQPVQTYSAPVQTSYQTQSYQAQATAECPAGTTPQSDGTCMQSSYSAPTTSYGSSSSYSSSSYSAPSSSLPAECPAGTIAQSDGTCMQSGSSSFSTSSSYSGSSYSDSSSSYGSGSSYSGGTPTNCPSGTVAQSDGTCMESGSSASYGSGSTYDNAYSGGSVELYTGDATTTSQSYGYSSDGTYGSSTDYLPIRK